MDRYQSPDENFWAAFRVLINHLIAMPSAGSDTVSFKLTGLRKLLQPIYKLQAKPLSPAEAYERFLREKNTQYNLGVLWKSFIELTSEPWEFFIGLSLKLKKSFRSPRTDKVISFTRKKQGRNNVSPDTLAVAYGDIYRSAFLATYLLAAVAVGMALLPIAFNFTHDVSIFGEKIFVYSEIIVILIMLLIVVIGRFKRWHERWLDYRIAAELIRHIRLISPLGGEQQLPPLPVHLAGYPHPSKDCLVFESNCKRTDTALSKNRYKLSEEMPC